MKTYVASGKLHVSKLFWSKRHFLHSTCSHQTFGVSSSVVNLKKMNSMIYSFCSKTAFIHRIKHDFLYCNYFQREIQSLWMLSHVWCLSGNDFVTSALLMSISSSGYVWLLLIHGTRCEIRKPLKSCTF